MSSECQWLMILQFLFPFLFVMNFSRHFASRGFMWSALAGFTSYYLFMLSVPLVLGTLGFLFEQVFRGVLIATGVLLTIRALWILPHLWSGLKTLRYKFHFVDPVIACALYLLFVNNWFYLVNDLKYGTGEFDGLNYHIPRVALWTLHGNFNPYPTATWQQLGHAFGGSASVLSQVFMGCGFIGAIYPGMVFTFGAGIALYVIGRSFGMSGRASLLATLAFMSFPATGIRVRGISTDIAATFPVIAGVAFFRTTKDLELAFFRFVVLAIAGFACKQYAAFCAALLFLVFLVQHRVALARTIAPFRGSLKGALVGLPLVLMSYYPIYRTFGDPMGGAVARELSSTYIGWRAVKESLVFTFINWISEPLSLLREGTAWEQFNKLGFADLYRYFSMEPGFAHLPHFNQNEGRSGVLPLLALPWLLFGVTRRYRLATLIGFIALIVAQMGPLKLNFTGRFIIIPLAAFALLWGARAQRQALLVAVWICAALYIDGQRVGLTSLEPIPFRAYQPGEQECRELPGELRDRPVLLVPRPLALDAYISGRAAELQFEYARCPESNNWKEYFASVKNDFKVIIFSTHESRFVPGPQWGSLYMRPCQMVSIDELRTALSESGWQFLMKSCGSHEAWTQSRT